MKFLYFILIIALTSCQQETATDLYCHLTASQCDSLLSRTALSSRERAAVVRQFVLQRSPNRGLMDNLSFTCQDSCLERLREVIAIAPADLQTDLKIMMLPFCQTDIVQHPSHSTVEIRKLMSDIENSTLTPLQEAWYFTYKSQYYTLQEATEEAFHFNEKAREKFRQINDKKGEFIVLGRISLLYMILKDYDKALHYCDSAYYLKGYEHTTKDLEKLQIRYSMIYARLGQYDKAIKARLKSSKDSLVTNSALAQLYIQAGRYNEALQIIEKQKSRKNTSFHQNYLLRTEAEIYEKLKQYDKAASIRTEVIRQAEQNSIQISKKYKELPGVPSNFASIYAQQAAWNWSKGKKAEAIKLMQKAEKLILRRPIVLSGNIQILQKLTDYYAELGDYRSALAIYRHIDTLQQHYNQQEEKHKFQTVQSHYEIEILNATIDKQRLEMQVDLYRHRLIYISVIAPVLLIALFILYYRKNRQLHNCKTNDKLKKS